jgi:cobalt-zinc-cadmium efflux system protein
MTEHSHDRGRSHEGGHVGHKHGDEPHGHSHTTHLDSGKLLGLALGLTAAFMLVEFAGGLLARSLALFADAGHMLTDSAALALAWAAARIASRPADTRRSFGYQRLRVIATFVNGCALLFIVAWIAIEAVQRLWHPVAVNATVILWIGSLGLAVNLLVYAMLRHGDEHDMNIAAATLHVIGDLMGSVAAIVAALVIRTTGWMPIDPLLSMFVCILIVRSAWSLVRRSAHILMEGTPDWLDVQELRRTLEQHIPAIHDVHHVHCWLVGPREALLTMHASIRSNADHQHVLREAKSVLADRFGITHATIQLEADECVDEECGPAVEEIRDSGLEIRQK